MNSLLLRWLWGTLSLLAACGMALAEPVKPLIVGVEQKYPLGGHFTLFHDHSGAMRLDKVEAAYQEGNFKPAAAAAPGLGFHDGAWWVRFEMHNVTSQTQERWLELDWPFQQSANLYLQSDDEQVLFLRNGAAVPIADRPMPTRQILYPVTLEPGAWATGYLRLSGPVASVVDLTLWNPSAYADHGRLVMAVRYLTLASLLALVVFSVLAWQARGSWLMLLGAAGNLLLVVLMFFVDGLMAGIVPLDENLWQSRISVVLLLLFIGANLLFANEFLDIKYRYPRLHRLLYFMAAATVVAAAYFIVVLDQPLAMLVHGVFVSFLILVSLFVGWRGTLQARIYLLAWSIMWCFFIVRNLSLQGHTPWLSFSMDLPLVGMALASLTLCYALFIDIRTLRREADQARSRLIAHQRDEQERLRQAVDERTRELEAAKERAEQASQAKSTFISVINHELRTPLHTILGYAHLLAKESPETLSDKIGVIEKNGNQLLRLIDDVLVFSRGEAGSRTSSNVLFSLQELAHRLQESFGLLATNGNRLVLALSPDLPPCVEADEQALTQILQNLLGNASKFTENGTITLRIAPTELSPDRPGMMGIHFSVEDTGIGIAPELQQRIFDPFSRAETSRHQPGVGLGLSIVRQLLRSMGSDIWVDSTPGAGSRFSFNLLLRVSDAEPEPVEPGSAPNIVGHHPPRRTLLIVDDIAENREFLKKLCERWGFDTVLAADGAEALDACHNPVQKVDAVLLDQFMPVVDGWEFLRRLRGMPQFNRLPVTLVSAAPPQPPENFSKHLQFDAILLKPINPNDLARILQRQLGLNWVLATKTEPAAVQPLTLPPQEELMAMRDALSVGRISVIKRRAESLLNTHPECAGFIREVLRGCQSIDLKGLERLLMEQR